MEFCDLAVYLSKLEKTSSRNEITAILAELFKKTTPAEIDKTVYLVLGQLAPNYEGLVLNLAEKMVIRILAQAYDKDISSVTSLYKSVGDLGSVAQELGIRHKGLGTSQTISDVFQTLIDVAKDNGAKSQERKVDKMADLLRKVDPLSARYIARIPVGKLRLGFSDMTILDALSFMLRGDKSARPEIEAAFNVNVDPGRIAKLVKERGLAGVKDIVPVAGIPIRSSLCERLPSAEKILEKVGKRVYVEPKYDGVRTQLHVWNGNIRIFSRNLENTTAMFPDLVAAAKLIKVESAIFDGEALAYDVKNDRFLPFQETIQRKRKHGIDAAVKDVPLKLFLFDILSRNGKSLLSTPFMGRRKILEETVKNNKLIQVTRQVETDSADTIRDLVKKFLTEGLEGAVVKKMDAPYKAGARGYHWVKYKKTTEKGVADTIDCLVMGTYKGKGKRTGFGVGAFLVGIKDGGKFKTVSKIGTGLSDEQWKELNTRTRKLGVSVQSKEYEVPKNLAPDNWVKPGLVVEILADEITVSPIHAASLALRFPRLIKFRDDKNPDQTTTLKELENLFKMQKV
jgi:DNA ligase-1